MTQLVWMTYSMLELADRPLRCERAVIPATPALETLQGRLSAEGWTRRDLRPAAYAVRYTDTTNPTKQSYEVGGLVVYVNQHDGCLLFVSLVSAPQTQPDPIEAINLSTVRVAGVRWPEAKALTVGKGLKMRQLEAAQTMMTRYGALLDNDAWVQVPYWTRGGRGGYLTKIAMREFKAGDLRNPVVTARQLPYRRLTGRFLSFRGTWVLGTASVRATESPDKVRVGHAILHVVRQPDAVELHNPVLEQPVWRFHPDEFARLDAAKAAVNG